MALIKLDLPLPESPVIAMFTSTSSNFMTNSLTADTTLSPISFLSSAILITSLLLKSPMLNSNGVSNVVERSAIHRLPLTSLSPFDVDCVQTRFFAFSYRFRDTSFKSLVMSWNWQSTKESGGLGLGIGYGPAARLRACKSHSLQSPIPPRVVEIWTIRSSCRHFGCRGEHNYFSCLSFPHSRHPR